MATDGQDADGAPLLDEAKLAVWLDAFGLDKLKELVGSYRAGSVENFKNLAAALTRQDVAQIGRAAHKIAGAAANLGFSALHRQGLAAENAAKAGDADRALRLGGEMAAVQDASWLALQAWLGGVETPS